jgi:hypothetical protein
MNMETYNDNRTSLTAETINQVYQDALADPSLLSTLNVDELLSTLETNKNDYLENKTLNGITDDVYNCVRDMHVDGETQENMCLKLVGYRLVEELHELHKGKHVRWIRRDSNKLTNGGIVVDIKFLDNGTHILCMNSMKRFIQYKYDDCITFQKLSPTELLILMIYEHATKLD